VSRFGPEALPYGREPRPDPDCLGNTAVSTDVNFA